MTTQSAQNVNIPKHSRNVMKAFQKMVYTLSNIHRSVILLGPRTSDRSMHLAKWIPAFEQVTIIKGYQICPGLSDNHLLFSFLMLTWFYSFIHLHIIK